jgi:hypothetical protein
LIDLAKGSNATFHFAGTVFSVMSKETADADTDTNADARRREETRVAPKCRNGQEGNHKAFRH